MTEAEKRNLPTASQIAAECRRVRYRQDYRRMLMSTFSSLLIAAAAAVLISLAVLPVLRVTGSGMSPVLQRDDLVLCSKLGEPERGDIAAFYFNNRILMKRVIGIAGDVIDIAEDGTVSVNGAVLAEPYVSEQTRGTCDIELPYTVPENRFFVMDDRRDSAADSRSAAVGCIAEEYIIGRVTLRLMPFRIF